MEAICYQVRDVSKRCGCYRHAFLRNFVLTAERQRTIFFMQFQADMLQRLSSGLFP